MEEEIKMRVSLAMDALKISVNSLAKDCNLKQNTLNEQINGASKIGIAAVAALLDKYPQISADWLLRGKEPMIVQPDDEMSDETKYYMSRSVKELELKLAETQNKIEELEDIINRQKRETDGLYERIDELKDTVVFLKKENAPTTIAHTV